MLITMKDRRGMLHDIVYPAAAGILSGRAGDFLKPHEITGSGIAPGDRIIVVLLPAGERATFDAPRWKVSRSAGRGDI